MEAELMVLKKKRTTYKAQLTRFCNFVNTFDPERENLETLHIRNETTKSLLTLYNDVQLQIELLNVEDADKREEFENCFFEVIGKATKILKMNALKNLGDSNSKQSSVSDRGSSPEITASINLPTMNLPKFDGRFEN